MPTEIKKKIKQRKININVEKNKKKAGFLLEIVKKIGLNVDIFPKNVELIKPQKADVISSRAFGKLDHLLKIAYIHQNKSTISIFPKGVSFYEELKLSKKNWDYELEKIINIIDQNSIILKIRNIAYAKKRFEKK